MKSIMWVLSGFLIGGILFLPIPNHNAKALSNREGKKGLFADISTSVDGVTIRRIRDVEAGTICYVASTPGNGLQFGVQPAISCVGWQP